MQIFRTWLSPAALETPAPSVKPGFMEGNRPCGDAGLLREWSTPWLRCPVNRPKKGCVVLLGTGKGRTHRGEAPPFPCGLRQVTRTASWLIVLEVNDWVAWAFGPLERTVHHSGSERQTECSHPEWGSKAGKNSWGPF